MEEGENGEDFCAESLAEEMETELEEDSLPKYWINENCIYRVPKLLRQTNEQAYEPVLLPIGPYHHPETQPNKTVQGLKLNYLNSFLGDNHEELLISCIKLVEKYEDAIHKSYAEPINSDPGKYDRKKFIKMVLTDSAFLIEFFRKGILKKAEKDLIWGNPSLKHEVFRDILLMENQMPFFILYELHSTAPRPPLSPRPGAQGENDEMTNLVSKFLDMNYGIVIKSPLGKQELDKLPHLLDLVRKHYVADMPARRPPHQHHNTCNCCLKRQDKVFPRATKLADANVKFQLGSSVGFDSVRGILTLPKLTVEGRTECLYRNLIAYERCRYPTEPYFLSYIYFMNCLIHTDGDVHLLAKAGIVESLLGNDDNLSQLLTSLCNNGELDPNTYLYGNQTEGINAYYRADCNHRIASFKHKYFASPWTIFSLIGAIFLLLLTLTQTVVALISLLKQVRHK